MVAVAADGFALERAVGGFGLQRLPGVVLHPDRGVRGFEVTGGGFHSVQTDRVVCRMDRQTLQRGKPFSGDSGVARGNEQRSVEGSGNAHLDFQIGKAKTKEMAQAFIQDIYIYPDSQIEIAWKFRDCFADLMDNQTEETEDNYGVDV